MLNIEKINTIIFDLDGTIIDTEPIYNVCWRKACKFFGYDLPYEEALNLRSLDSDLAKNYLTNLLGEDFSYEMIRKKRKEFMDVMIGNDIKLKPNIANLLTILKNLKYNVAICSASSRETIIKYLKCAKINFDFDAIISAKSVQRGKPYPDAYIYACKVLDVKPENVLVVEDAPNGIISAHNSGCNVAMIPDLTLPTPEIMEKLDIYFKDLYDFELFLKQNLMNK